MCARAVNSAGLDLTEVSEELGEHLVRTTDETARASEQLGVRKLR